MSCPSRQIRWAGSIASTLLLALVVVLVVALATGPVLALLSAFCSCVLFRRRESVIEDEVTDKTRLSRGFGVKSRVVDCEYGVRNVVVVNDVVYRQTDLSNVATSSWSSKVPRAACQPEARRSVRPVRLKVGLYRCSKVNKQYLRRRRYGFFR